MNNSNNPLSCAEVNNRNIVDYLSSLGFEPTRISRHHYWYLLPLRKERTASFKVNSLMNCWYDFGEGRGGTIVDFGILYFKCSVYEFLQQLFLSSSSNLLPINNHPKGEKEESSIEVTNVKTITSPSLRNYLKERKIDIDIAHAFCKEVCFRMNGKNYYAIGFKNDSGGYELRNSFFKGSTHPKDITSIRNSSKRLSLFEGFFDFLSYKTVVEKSVCVNEDYCILNSLSFLNRAKDITSSYDSLHLFFDRDKSGVKATSEMLQFSNQVTDESQLYKNHKDMNDWLVQFGLSTTHSLDKG